MHKKIAALSLYIVTLFASAIASAQDNPVVVMETNKGTIKIEVWQDKAPLSAANFLRYVDENYYNGLIFHRVIPDFMAQGGGFDEDMVQKSAYEMIKNEASAATPNNRGTLAMARTNVIDSATSQFFINLVDNDFLNHTDETPRGFGYAVFAKVIEGMDIVDAMATVKTANKRGHQNVPVDPIVMTRVTRQD
jgi:cyclophilin family peptidyl-prolyl cis-trans isomerase